MERNEFLGLSDAELNAVVNKVSIARKLNCDVVEIKRNQKKKEYLLSIKTGDTITVSLKNESTKQYDATQVQYGGMTDRFIVFVNGRKRILSLQRLVYSDDK